MAEDGKISNDFNPHSQRHGVFPYYSPSSYSSVSNNGQEETLRNRYNANPNQNVGNMMDMKDMGVYNNNNNGSGFEDVPLYGGNRKSEGAYKFVYVYRHTQSRNVILTILASVAMVFTIMCVIKWMRSGDVGDRLFENKIDANKMVVYNVYNASRLDRLLDTATIKTLTSSRTTYGMEVKRSELQSGYVDTFVHGIGRANVSIDQLRMKMAEKCPHRHHVHDETEEFVNDNREDCHCITSIHLGVTSNMVMINRDDNTTVFMVNPEIKEYFPEKEMIKVCVRKLGDTNEKECQEYPNMIAVDSINRDSKKERYLFKGIESVCAHQSIALVGSIKS